MDKFLHASAANTLATVTSAVCGWPELSPSTWGTVPSLKSAMAKGVECWRGSDVRHLFATSGGRAEALVHSKQSSRLYYYVWLQIGLEGETAGKIADFECACPTDKRLVCAHVAALYYSAFAVQHVRGDASSESWPPLSRPFKLVKGNVEIDNEYAPFRRWAPGRLALSSCNAVFAEEDTDAKGNVKMSIRWLMPEGKVSYESDYVQDVQLGHSLRGLAAAKKVSRDHSNERRQLKKAAAKAAVAAMKVPKKRPRENKPAAAGMKRSRVDDA